MQIDEYLDQIYNQDQVIGGRRLRQPTLYCSFISKLDNLPLIPATHAIRAAKNNLSSVIRYCSQNQYLPLMYNASHYFCNKIEYINESFRTN